MGQAGSALDRAESLYELISSEAAESDRGGKLTDKAAQALLDTNLPMLLLPAAAGGLGASRREFFESVEQVAKADGSAGWCLSVCSSFNFLIHMAVPDDVRCEIFGAGPVASFGSLIPCAQSVPAEGGARLSGSFAWGSASSFSDWAIVTEFLPERDGEQWFRSFVVPKSEVEIDHDSWNPMGLKATASINYRIDDLFVPESRIFEYPVQPSAEAGPVSALLGGLLNRLGLTAFATGVAARAMAELVARAPETRRTGFPGTQAESETVQHGIGIHEGRMNAARSHLLDIIDEQDRIAAEGEMIDGRYTLPTGHAVLTLIEAARDATVFAWDSVSTSVVLGDDPLQRCVRDIFTGLKHVTFAPTGFTHAGRLSLGLDISAFRF